MSGHSHWATIRRKKGASDAKRGQLFTRLTREIVMAAREGGGDIDSNFRLRIAVDKARAQSMPKENIERGIKRGTGDSKDGVVFEQVFYEGYGSNSVALIVECVTENRNRTVADLRHMLSRLGGNLGESGSVSWQFRRVSYFSIPAAGNDFDKIFELAVEGGADDVTQDDDEIEVVGPVESFKTLIDAFRKAGIQPDEGELRFVANQEMELSVSDTLQALHGIEQIEDLDDVQNVYSNLKVSEEAMAAMEAE